MLDNEGEDRSVRCHDGAVIDGHFHSESEPASADTPIRNHFPDFRRISFAMRRFVSGHAFTACRYPRLLSLRAGPAQLSGCWTSFPPYHVAVAPDGREADVG